MSEPKPDWLTLTHLEDPAKVTAAVLDNLDQAMYGLKGLSGKQEPDSEVKDSHSDTSGSDDYDDLDYTDHSWTGGRYDYQEQKDFIKKMVLHFSGYRHDPEKTPKERYEERKRILNDRNTQHRRLFAQWPSSEKVMSSFHPQVYNYKGLAPPNTPPMWNGPGIWGATLFDLYNIYCLHPSALFQTSGSKMLTFYSEHGDTSAATELAWAMTEPEPELIEPCDIGELIETSEHRVGMFGGMMPASPPVLQQYLPQHLLPETLVVCDPNQVLYTSDEKGASVRQRYKLQFSAKYDARRKEDEAAEAQATAEAKSVYDAFLADPHSRNALPNGRLLNLTLEEDEMEEGPTHQRIYYVYPLPPARAPTKEAQLLISEDQLLGTGNHSYVYDASFLLPRTTFFEPRLCGGCVREDLQEQISKYKFSPTFLTDNVGRMVAKDELLQPQPESRLHPPPAPRLHTVLSYEGPLIALQSTVKCSHTPCAKHRSHARPPRALAKVRVVAKLSRENDAHLAREAENYQHFPKYLFEHWSGLIKVPGIRNPVPAGPVVPQFYGYYVPDCEEEDAYDDGRGSSGGGDDKPEDNLEGGEEARGERTKNAAPFLSPILLIENCGDTIEPEEYGFDDTQECCSLVFRLKYAGFIHASVASRNIVAQNGPLSAWPLERNLFPGGYANKDYEGGPSGKSFRLIDFGRTEFAEDLDIGTRRNLALKDHLKMLQWSDGREILNERW